MSATQPIIALDGASPPYSPSISSFVQTAATTCRAAPVVVQLDVRSDTSPFVVGKYSSKAYVALPQL